MEKDPGIPNDWPFKEQELKALEVRRARAIEELEQKKAARKERVISSSYSSSCMHMSASLPVEDLSICTVSCLPNE